MKIMLMIVVFVVSVVAETFTLIVPQKPGEGTAIWAELVAKEMQRHMPEDVVQVRYLPGGRDIPGFNEFHNKLRKDPTNIMVSHGGNAFSFLQETVDYDYREYSSIGSMALNVVVSKKIDDKGVKSFAAGSGMEADVWAITLMLCGNDKTIEEYGNCLDKTVKFVKGMSGGERRLAFKRDELTITREVPQAHKKFIVDDKTAELWFHHGMFVDGKVVDDNNYVGYKFEDVFYRTFGEQPRGEFYDAYVVMKVFRDTLQKALWVDKDSRYVDKLRSVIDKLNTDATSVANIQHNIGNYTWVSGKYTDANTVQLLKLLTYNKLRTMTKFNSSYLKYAVTLKLELLNEYAQE